MKNGSELIEWFYVKAWHYFENYLMLLSIQTLDLFRIICIVTINNLYLE